MKRWLIVGIVALAALVGLVYGIGALLPTEHTVAMRATYEAPQGRLYEAIANYYRAPRWRSDVDSVTPLDPVEGHPRWREHGAMGSVTYEADVTEPPGRYRARIVDDDLPYGGSWTFTIDPSDAGGTDLMITERGTVRSPLFRFLSRFVFGHHAAIERYLKDLGEAMGEEVDPSKVDTATTDAGGGEPTG